MSLTFPNLPAAIAAYTSRNGQTQASLARALGVSRGTVTRWVNGEEPEVSRLSDIARELGVSIAYLADDADYIQTPDERSWIDYYRKQPDEVRQALLQMAHANVPKLTHDD
ncbi:MAG TPA: helix-turn-helix transcriptional regulator [Rhodanobacteraceae bacterium]|nr:helix-turn-helix transcriptional regulator [Rhodanobacteraceae bacterium]